MAPTEGSLFPDDPPEKRRRRGWTALDRLRRRIERMNQRIARTGGTERDLERRDRLAGQIARREEEAKRKWKRSFGD